MSRKSLEAKKLAVAGATALAALGVVSAPASAAVQKTLTYSCSYPLIGPQPLKVDITADIPTAWEQNKATPPFAISVKATALGDTWIGLKTIGAAKLTGTGRASTSIVQGGGATLSPGVLVNLAAYDVPDDDPGAAGLDLTASGSTPAVTFFQAGPAKISLGNIALTLRATGPAGEAITAEDPEYAPDTDNDPTTLNIVCKPSPTTQDLLLTTVQIGPLPTTPDTTAPSVPGAGSTSNITTTGATVSWGASTDETGGSGLKGYEYKVNGGTAVATTATSATLSGLTAGADQTVTVVAVDNAGNKSAERTITFKTSPIVNNDTTAPSVPGSIEVSPTSSGGTVTWAASTDNAGGSGVKNYDVQVNGGAVQTVTDTTATLSGLTASTSYTVSVKARDNAGNVSAAGTKQFTTTGGTVVPYNYTLAGSATLKNLTKGTLPLSGKIAAKLTLGSGAIEADLTLNKTSANLTALGILPVRADVDFVSTAKTTGTLINGVLKTNSKVRIKLPKVTAFGIQLAGGSNCQTRSVSSIDLRSTQATFLPTAGGPIAGSFTISNLSGCGFLEGIVSPLTAGSGNTIALNLTPAAK